MNKIYTSYSNTVLKRIEQSIDDEKNYLSARLARNYMRSMIREIKEARRIALMSDDQITEREERITEQWTR